MLEAPRGARLSYPAKDCEVRTGASSCDASPSSSYILQRWRSTRGKISSCAPCACNTALRLGQPQRTQYACNGRLETER